MRALRAHNLDGPSALAVDEVPEPVAPADDMVRIAVHAAGIGFVDTLVARGLYQVRQEPPYTPGMEVVHTYEGTDSIQSLIVGRDVTGISAFV